MSNKILVPIIVLAVLLLAIFLVVQLPIFEPALPMYVDEEKGFGLDHPEGWVVDSSTPFVTFITRDPLSNDPEEEVVGLAVYPIPSERITEAMGRSAEDVTLQELWDEAAPPTAENVQPFSVGGEEGLRGRLEDPVDDVRSWVVLTQHGDTTYMIIAIARPASLWQEYEPQLTDMLESFQFIDA